jgi:hypothetical protein
VIQKEGGKKLKYKNLSTEIQRIVVHEMLCQKSNHWGQGSVSKGLKEYLATFFNTFSTKKKKPAVLGKSHIIRKVLQADT